MTISDKRRQIIDRIQHLRGNNKPNDFINKWVCDLYEQLDKIDRAHSAAPEAAKLGPLEVPA